MALTDSVVQQLLERTQTLAGLADQLSRGEHLRPAVSTAQDPSVWSGAPQRTFCEWLGALDGWIRSQLGGGIQALAERIESHARNLENAQRQLDAGIPGVTCPPPPRPVGNVPGRPPEFVMRIPRLPGPISIAPDAMKNLVNLLEQAKDAFLDTGRRVADSLAPLTVPPVVPEATVIQIAAQLTPTDHLPPDALAAAGCPAAWTELAHQLDRALHDVHDRAECWARAAAADEASNAGGLLPGLASIGAALDRAAALAPVPSEADRLAAEQGAADAERLATLMWGKKVGRCPDFDEAAGFLADIRAKGANNPAYAQGFSAAMGAMHHKQYGLEQGNGFERFSRIVEICWANKGKHLDDAKDRLLRPLGEIFSAATHDANFDITLAEHLLESGLGGGYVFSCGPLRTDVALLVADHWIDKDAWAKGGDLYHIVGGLRVLAANPEAAHLYVLDHAETLTKGTDPGLFHDPSGGGILGDWDGPWDHGVAALAADVLRIGLVDYPAHLTACAAGDAAAEVVQAADAARRASEEAMGAAVRAVGKGADLGPEGRLVVAGFLASHISDLAAALDTDVQLPGLRQEHLVADKKDVNEAFKQVMRDPASRKVLLGGASEALGTWSGEMTRFVSDDLARNPEMRLRDVVGGLGGADPVGAPARQLGTFFGQLATAVRANAQDEHQAAAEFAGFFEFFLSQVFGNSAAVAGTALGGGVAGIAVAYGAGELAKAADSFITRADDNLRAAKDAKQLRERFIGMATDQMEHMAAVSLWSDERIRARLLAGEPPNPAVEPLPATQPPLEEPPGRLRIPAPDEHPAFDQFRKWFEHDGRPLRTAAQAAVQNSGMLDAFQTRVMAGLFGEG